MAEFEEVMRMAARMCNTQKICSNECPAYIYGDCLVSVGRGLDKINYTDVANAIIAWAKEHSEPVYPSWEEGWKQLFPHGEMQCPNDLFDAHVSCTVGCTACKTRPMLPRISEKLGIKPIGGK